MKKTTTRIIYSIIFGVFICIILLEISLYLGGLLFVSSQESVNKITLQKKDAYRILCLGDSTTAIGGKDSWSSQLEEALNNRKLRKEFSVINKGVVLADSTSILSMLEGNLKEYNPRMIIIMAGINDAQKSRENNSSFNKVKSLLKRLRTYRLIELLQPYLSNKKIEYIPSEEIYQNPAVKSNFNRIKKVLDKQGIKLVMMQYPLRDVEPLKKVFDSEEGIIFVDNELIFQNAMEHKDYKEYFMDNFGGDFGHCTQKGNHMIAENIADTLLKEGIF